MIEALTTIPDHVGDQVSQRRDASVDRILREQSEKFEAAFLTEMLRHSGLGKMRDGLNGGAGEARFSGFLIEAYAEKLAQSGQIGLADHIYRDLVARGGQE